MRMLVAHDGCLCGSNSEIPEASGPISQDLDHSASGLRGFLRLSDRTLRSAKLKPQLPRAGNGAAVDLCGRELPALCCAQSAVRKVAAWARRFDGSMGDIPGPIDLDTDFYFEVASNGANDLCWYVGQGLVCNRPLDDAFGGFGCRGERPCRLRGWRCRWCGSSEPMRCGCRGGLRSRRLRRGRSRCRG
jgi:hypothetical protein